MRQIKWSVLVGRMPHLVYRIDRYNSCMLVGFNTSGTFRIIKSRQYIEWIRSNGNASEWWFRLGYIPCILHHTRHMYWQYQVHGERKIKMLFTNVVVRSERGGPWTWLLEWWPQFHQPDHMLYDFRTVHFEHSLKQHIQFHQSKEKPVWGDSVFVQLLEKI